VVVADVVKLDATRRDATRLVFSSLTAEMERGRGTVAPWPAAAAVQNSEQDGHSLFSATVHITDVI